MFVLSTCLCHIWFVLLFPFEDIVKVLYFMSINKFKKMFTRLYVIKFVFYCVNTSYPMDQCLSGRRGPAHQTSEKDVLCLHRLSWPSTVHSPGGV